MKRIENKTYDLERSLYNLKDTIVDSCSFKGPKDGESVLKESRNIIVSNCDFSLRYPLWHARQYQIKDTIFNEPSRAPIWYAFNGSINNCKIYSVKAVRECDDIEINKSEIISPEFGWKSNHIRVNDSRIESEYLFLDSKNININNSVVIFSIGGFHGSTHLTLYLLSSFKNLKRIKFCLHTDSGIYK